MNFQALSNEELMSLKQGGYSALSDDALMRLKGIAQKAEPIRAGAAAAMPSPAGAGVMERLAKGMTDPVNAGAQMASEWLPEAISGPINKADQWLFENTGGLFGSPQETFSKRLQEEEAAYQANLAPEGVDWARMAGGIAGGAPMPFGAAATIPKAIAAGAAGGTLAPVTDEGDSFLTEKVKQAALGGAGGGVLGTLMRGFRPGALHGKEDIAELVKSGVNPTTGQRLGGAWNTAEEKAMSVPFLGSSITEARKGAMDEFNTATINRALEAAGAPPLPAGQLGHSAVDDAQKAISKLYNEALEGVERVSVNNRAIQQSDEIRETVRRLQPAGRRRLNNVIRGLVENRSYTGAEFKKLDSSIGAAARKYQRSMNPDDQDIATILGGYQDRIREQFAQQHPAAAERARLADAGYARLVQIDDAATRAGMQGGEFTPGQLVQAVRKNESSTRKRGFAAGRALEQDWAQNGQRVLGNKYPDSGTAGRMMPTLLTGAGGASLVIDPVTTAAAGSGLAATRLLYTPAGQRMINGFLSRGATIEEATQAAIQALSTVANPTLQTELNRETERHTGSLQEALQGP